MAAETAEWLFLFKPANAWAYCGGATIICAALLEDAIVLGNALKNEMAEDGKYSANRVAETRHTDRGFVASGGGGVGVWVFVEAFHLAESRAVGLVFTDANYA